MLAELQKHPELKSHAKMTDLVYEFLERVLLVSNIEID